MRSRHGMAVCLLVACNQIYGLEPTVLVEGPADTDGDGIVDDLDLCDDVPDPLQLDTDGDGEGDACDPCAFDPTTHDEDGDALIDGCDNCPQLANADQQNMDGDDLGDVCDHDMTSMQTRQHFEPFASALNQDWVYVFLQWAVVDDAVAPTMDTASTAGLWNQQHRAFGRTWYIEVAFTIDDTNVDSFYGIQGFEPTSKEEFPCRVERLNGMWRVIAKSALVNLTAAPQGPLVLRLRREPTMMHCELVGIADAKTIDNLSNGHQPGIQTKTLTRFRYMDIVSGE